MKINFSKIFYITFFSIIISLLYNHFNPNGVELIRKARILKWESDSLVSLNKLDSLTVDDISVNSKQTVDSVITDKKIETVETFKEPKAIKINFAYKLFNDGENFIDARSSEEFSEGHIKGAISIPFYESEKYLNVINTLNKNDIVVVYCSSNECDISTLSGDELFKMGFKKVYVFVAGWEEWVKNKYPISLSNK